MAYRDSDFRLERHAAVGGVRVVRVPCFQATVANRSSTTTSVS